MESNRAPALAHAGEACGAPANFKLELATAKGVKMEVAKLDPAKLEPKLEPKLELKLELEVVDVVVLIEITFQGKRKRANHKSSTTISELLKLYERRIGGRTGGAAMRVCDAWGVEQGLDVTLGMLHAAARSIEGSLGIKEPVQLCFEQDDWFD